MSIYQVKHRLRINNEVHPAGKNISLTDEQAQPLLKAGVVLKLLEPVSPPASAPAIEVATPVSTPTAETVPNAPELSEIATADLPSNDNNAYGKLTKAELNAELDKRGIIHDAKAINADLEALLVADDSKKAKATTNPTAQTPAK